MLSSTWRRFTVTFRCIPAVAVFGVITYGAVALGGTYAPTPSQPVLSPPKITFNGGDEDGSITLYVEDGATISISASTTDVDTLTIESASTESDGAQIVWSVSGGGSISSSRSNSGQSITFTAPTLGESETSRTVTLTAQPDDDSTADPGDPLNGHSGNRNDEPGTGVTLTVEVTKQCKVTKVTTANDYVKIGTDVGFTAEGTNLATAAWTGGGDPATGTGGSFTTKWDSSGSKTVTAACGGTSKSKTVKVVKVTALSLDSTSNSAWNGANNSVVAVKKSGEKVVLKATTDPDEAGAWALIDWAGGDAVAANKRSVSKGSSGKTDVTATVGTSSATKKVVVVWVTITNFNTTGPKPTDSDVDVDVCWGADATKACNGGHTQATVDSVDADTFGVTFEWKQTAEATWWKKVGGTWTKGGDTAAGSDDSPNAAWCDVTPSATGHIYTTDTPDWKAPFPATWESAVQAISLTQWVNVKVGGNTVKGSDDHTWHSFIWVDKVGGTWGRHATFNEISAGSAAINHTDPPPSW